MSEVTPAARVKTAWYMGGALYDALKFVALVILPAIGTLYFALDAAWGWGHGTQVVGTITSIDTFLGVLTHVSSKSYHASDISVDGTVDVATDDDGNKAFSLNLNGDPHQLADQQKITFKVNAPLPPILPQ